MYNETEQKILDAALKIFAERGYVAATTRLIADESGFTEMTLFRKFKTKKELYEAVLAQKSEVILEDISALLSKNKFESVEEFLNYFIRGVAKIYNVHFEFIHIITQVQSEKYASLFMETHTHIAEILEMNIQDENIDYLELALDISSVVYMRSLYRWIGNPYMDYEKSLNGYINNIIYFICK